MTDMEPTMMNCVRAGEFIPISCCGGAPLPESPRVPMEFLSRSWSASALEVTKAISPLSSCMPPKPPNGSHSQSHTSTCIPEEETSAPPPPQYSVVSQDQYFTSSHVFKNQFSFATSATSQLVLDRIMSHSSTREEVSPLTSGRLSHSSEPLNNGGTGSFTGTDSPTLSHSDEFDDVVKFFGANNSIQHLFNGTTTTTGGRGSITSTSSVGIGNGGCTVTKSSSKTVGRWLKERREKKKEETRTHNAQLHATISVAALAAALAAITAATAATSSNDQKNNIMANKTSSMTDMAVASAATLVAAQCVEAAEAMGAERDHLASAVASAVNVRSHDDITTLTAAAATALRGAATLKARALKEVWNIASVTPVLEKGMGGNGNGITICGGGGGKVNNNNNSGEINVNGSENFTDSQELLARGAELLKRTRNGDLHWKIVSVYIHRTTGQVMLKMKSKHVAGTITKKNKNVVLDVCTDLPAWTGRDISFDGEKRCYFGLKTESRGIVEFECRNQREYDIWTQGVSTLLSIVKQTTTYS